MTSWKNLSPAKKRRSIIIMILAMGIIPVAIYLFPHALNKKWLIDVIYFQPGGKQRVITLYQEIGNSDDGSYLTGYWLYLYDPINNKKLDKIFVKRSENNTPQNPEIHFFDEKEIWIIGRPGFASGEKTFTAILEIKDDKFQVLPLDFLKGWTIQSVFSDRVSMVNQFNEVSCLDVKTRNISPENCESISEVSPTTPRSGFFFAKNTSTSTRCRLYYYSTTANFAPAGIFAGYVPPDGTIPGWHLMDAVSVAYGGIDQSLMEAYKAKFDTSEHLVAIQENQLFNNPKIISSNDTICTLVAMNDDGKTYTLYQFNSRGKKIWSVQCPAIKNNTSVISLNGQYSATETILTHPQNWVICINNSDGGIKWQCPK